MTDPGEKGLLAWFARNHHAANLLMIVVLAVGIISIFKIKQEVFPVFVLDTVVIDIQYRGAGPEEVEQSVIVPIESELRGLEMVKRLEAVASEGNAQVIAELFPGFDRNRALQEITAAVQRISVFPEEIEPPVISLGEGRRQDRALQAGACGDEHEQGHHGGPHHIHRKHLQKQIAAQQQPHKTHQHRHQDQELKQPEGIHAAGQPGGRPGFGAGW